jgi:DNA-binding protein HU-beta
MFSKAQFVEELRNKLPEVFETKVSAERAFDAFCDIISEAVADSGDVRLSGVGSFHVAERAQRSGRNPQTGEPITIPAHKVVKFSTSKQLKEAINGG